MAEEQPKSPIVIHDVAEGSDSDSDPEEMKARASIFGLKLPFGKHDKGHAAPASPDAAGDAHDVPEEEEGDQLNVTLGKERANIEDLIREGGATRKLREITAMVAWANTFLKPRGYEAKLLQQDFRDGVLMINLLEATFNKTVTKNYNLRPKLPVQKLDNYEWVFKFLNQEEIHTLSIDPHDIVNGKETQTLNLLWNILRKLTVTGLAGLSGQKDKSSATVREMLKQWVNGKAYSCVFPS
jgi:hypothetical protein